MKIVVIGGGLSGLQASIELADHGYDVIIVEKEPYLGGNALYLHKYFPSYPLDCSYCIQSCRDSTGIRKCFYRSGIHSIENIKIYTLSEIKDIKEENGRFKIEIIKRPRYVDENRCVNCKRCEDVCPVTIQDNYSKRKAIYINDQGIPPVYTIDIKSCKKCGKCLEVCQTNAIILDDNEKIFEEIVDRIIVATGFEEYKPYDIIEYKYGKSSFVITQFELAKILSQQKKGLIVNGRKINRVLMIQCVASRDVRRFKYCSKICCLYALKHAIMLKELDNEIDIYIAFMDIRSYGLYEFWYSKARELGVKFIRGRPGSIEEHEKHLKVYVENTLEQKLQEIDVDLVVLSSALVPNKSSLKIFKLLGIETDEYGFAYEDSKIVSISGTASQIRDVPETIKSSISSTLKFLDPIITEEIKKRREEAVMMMYKTFTC